MAVREPATVCTIHGKLDGAWCPECDAIAGVERHPVTGKETTEAERKQAMVDALVASGLSQAQVQLVLSTLERGASPAVSDAQLHRVLNSLQGRANPVAVDASVATPPVAQNESAVVAGLREAGWSDDRIAEAIGHPVA